MKLLEIADRYWRYLVGLVGLFLDMYIVQPIHCVPKKHVTTFSTITLTISVRLQ